MITGKINLLNLIAAKQMVKGKDGDVECLIIPIEKNKLYVGEKGIYLDLVAFDIKTPKADSKDTHIVKQSFSKEVRDAMTEDQISAMPILGNLAVLSGERSEKPPVSSTETLSDTDDLPF